MENVLIDFVVNDDSLQPAIDRLIKLGEVDAKVANNFKQTSAELTKQANAVKSVGDNLKPATKGLQDLANASKQTSSELVKGFQDGVNDVLQETGVSITELRQKLGLFKTDSPFDKLNKSLQETTKRTLDTSAQLERLRRTGAVGTEAFNKLEKQLQADQRELKKLSDQLAAVRNTAEGLSNVTPDPIVPPNAAPAIQSIRTELRVLTEQIARAKAAGLDYGESFDALVAKAGRLRDAIGDATKEINNLASDTSTFDGLVSAASGVAGAFSLAQGAAALFGDESEELQEVLLRVNAAMAIAQGLQQVQQVLQKESAASRLADVIATKAQTVAQTAYNFVVGTSTGLLKAFRIALAATGVGLLVIALIELYNAFSDVNDSLERANDLLARNKALLDADLASAQRRAAIEIARAQSVGKAESEVIRIRGRALQEQRALAVQAQKEAIQQRNTVDATSEAYAVLNTRVEELNDVIGDIDQQTQIEALNLVKQVADEQKEAAEKAKKDSEEAAQKARARRNEELQDIIAAIERRLLAVEEGSRAELELRKRLVSANADLELNAENLTANEIKLIRERSLKERDRLQKEFNLKLRSDAIAGVIAANNAELSLLKTNNDDRLILQTANIELAAQLEIDAAEGNGAKIKEIIAKRDQDIRDTKIRFIKEAVDYEISLEAAKGGTLRRALEQIASDENASLNRRILAISEITRLEVEGIDKQIDALQAQKDQKLINDQDYQLQYEQLLDKRRAATEAAETKITDTTKKENEKRKQSNQELFNTIVESAQTVIGIFDSLSKLSADRETQRLEAQKRAVSEQLKAGQITERAAIDSQRRIEVEERKFRIKQAQRDKQIAIFNAVINTAAAVVKAAPVIPLMAFAAAAGAAQIAIIAARPIPQFAKGKKKGESYTGFGQVAERGAELIERDGQMYLIPKPTVIHIKSKDIIHTATETKTIFDRAKSMLNNSKESEQSIFYNSTNNNFHQSEKLTQAEKIAQSFVEKSVMNKLFFEKASHTNNNIHTNGTTINSISKEFFNRVVNNAVNNSVNNSAILEKIIQSKSYFDAVTHKVDKQIMNHKEVVKTPIIDSKTVDAIGKSVAKHNKSTSVNIDANGFTISVKDGINTINYMNNRYKSP